MVSVSVCYLFYQPMDEKNKTWTPRFPAKENPNMEKALFDWPILLQYDVKAISRKFFGHEVFSAERSLNQPKPRRVCIRSINQSNRCISVCLLFLFCSRVFISRSYENRSILIGCLIFVLAVCCIYYLGVSGSRCKRFASWIWAFNFCIHLICL